jgi:lipoprotein-releasing system ATP-binding protein
MNNPKILFGDEPTGNLDSKNTSMVLDILQDLKAEFNQTILMVTHDLQFAERADRVIAIRDGRIVNHE